MFQSQYVFSPIGMVHSPHRNLSEIPIQPAYARDITGTIEIFDPYVAGLKGLDGFSHIHLLFVFNESHKSPLVVKPYLSDEPQGVFATRSPHRPNKLGLSLLELERIDGTVLHVLGVDILNGTPVLDIKPYVSRFDVRENTRSGWQEQVDEVEAQARGRRDYQSSSNKE